MSENRGIRVFVSSTFRDMVEERDALMTHVWPELRRFCRERQVEFVEVDLRWGIPEEHAARKETLKLCLEEIGACRPFFIGILGERYGWTPGNDALTADLIEEQSWLQELSGKSVTELEILHGVLNDPEMAGRSFFYFRDQTYAQSHGADFLAEDTESAQKLAALKARIRQTCADQHIPLRENYSDPRALAEFVLKDLEAVIAVQFPAADILDALAREARDHEAFAIFRRRTYIGRTGYFARLDEHARGDGTPLVVLGESGSGKSALLANWVELWRQRHPADLIFQHFIGGTHDSADHWKLMARLSAEIKRWTGDPEEVRRSPNDLLRDFPVWLNKARRKAERDGVRVIIILDALNQLEDRDHARRLGWLPLHAFTGPLRLIVSTLPLNPRQQTSQKPADDPLQALAERGCPSLAIEPLTPDERRRMIADYLHRFGKKLDFSRLERLSTAPATANPLYLKILLDELRVTGTHERLDERLSDYLSAQDIPGLLALVLSRCQRDYERDRPGLVGEALAAIWAARRGLTEMELLQLLRPPELPQLPASIWSPLRAALEEALVDRGGILNFAHEFLRAAVETAFLPDKVRQDALRMRLASYFEQLHVSARSCDELPWLLERAGASARLHACLLDVDRFLEILKRDREELMLYWVGLGEERAMGRFYCASFEAWSKQAQRPPSDISLAANELFFFLSGASLEADAEPLIRQALAIEEQISGPDHPAVAVRLSNLAQMLKVTGRIQEAEPLMRRALAIDERHFGPAHPSVAIRLNNLALLLRDNPCSGGVDTNTLVEAESLYRRGLAIKEQNFGPDHPEVARVLANLAVLLHDTRRLAQAEETYRRALEILERNYGPRHPSLSSVLCNFGQLMVDREDEYRAMSLIDRLMGKSPGSKHPGRLEEAEVLMRRALAIEEESAGLDHPKVAIRLYNLVQVLRSTQRFAEAEPLARRELAIIANFVRATGHQHVLLTTTKAVENYAEVLSGMGLSADLIAARLQELGPEFSAAWTPSWDDMDDLDTKDLDSLRGWNNLSHELRKRGEVQMAEYIDWRLVKATVRLLGKSHPVTIHRRNNRVVTLMMLGKLSEARELLGQNWRACLKCPTNLSPRIVFLRYVAALLKSRPANSFLGQLKSLLLGSELQAAEGVVPTWEITYFIEHLRPQLPPGFADFLAAVVAAINDRAKLHDLARFAEWRNQPSVPLETAWSDG